MNLYHISNMMVLKWPIITYRSVVWWSKMKKRTKQLNSIRRYTCVGESMVMRTYDPDDLNTMTHILPIDLSD